MKRETADRLAVAYTLLRRVEHRIQYLDDQQTHTLPRAAEDRELVARSMGCPDYAALREALDEGALERLRRALPGQKALAATKHEHAQGASLPEGGQVAFL